MKKDTRKKRLQFDCFEETIKEIDTLRTITGIPTRAALFHHALRLFGWVFEETQKNRAILILEKNGKQREVIFPFWKPTSVQPPISS